MRKRVVLFGVILVLFNFVSAIDYYVAKDGSGDFSTIQAAVNVAQAEDTVHVKEGTYNERVVLQRSGSSGNYITFRNYGNDEVIIDGSGLGGSEWEGIIDNEGKSYIIIQGFHITNGASGITFDDASNFEIRDNIISYMTIGPGIIVGGHGSDFKIDNNEIHHCDSRQTALEALRVMEYTSDFEITNNVVHHNTNIGIVVVGWVQYGKPERGLVSGNIAHHNIGSWCAGIYVDSARNITVEHNIAYANTRGFELGCEPTGDIAENNIFRYNIAYDNEQSGLQVGGYQGGIVRNCQVYNNVFYNNDRSEIGFDNTPGHDNEFFNNILYDPGTTLVNGQGSQNTFDHNIYYNQGGPGSQNLIVDPLFVDAANHDFHLQAGSPACGSGRNNEDIGVYSCGTNQNCTDQGYYCCPSGYICSDPRTGSGCGAGETCCASQTSCTPELCGNSQCDLGECNTCPQDCDFDDCCPDGTCNNNENCSSCSEDCGECPSLCSEADTNTDGVVDITELMNYISEWKLGSVTIQELMTGIGEWKNGC